MSRLHAEISFDGTDWHIRDLDSRNGTFVDGDRLTAPRVTHDARILRIGDTIFGLMSDLRAFEYAVIEERDDVVVGPTLRQAWEEIESAAKEGRGLHLTGESGCGKELAAKHFHRSGPRSRGPFIAVNCAAIPVNLAERLLFRRQEGRLFGRRCRRRWLCAGGARRHAVSRRGRRARLDGAGQALARAGDQRRHGAGLVARAHRRHHGVLGDAPRSARAGGGGQVPQRPLVPHRQPGGRAARAARSHRGHSVADSARAHQAGRSGAARVARRELPVAAVAGQRARAGVGDSRSRRGGGARWVDTGAGVPPRRARRHEPRRRRRRRPHPLRSAPAKAPPPHRRPMPRSSKRCAKRAATSAGPRATWACTARSCGAGSRATASRSSRSSTVRSLPATTPSATPSSPRPTTPTANKR